MDRYLVYFSPNINTAKVVTQIGNSMDIDGQVPIHLDSTNPNSRIEPYVFEEGELAIFGFPTYAGKLPNKILPFIKDIKGNGALAVAVVTYGNRSYDNSLAELVASLQSSGFRVISGVAVPCQHAFSDKLAKGRPDNEDMARLGEMAGIISEKVRSIIEGKSEVAPLMVPGDPDAPYYTPLGMDGEPAKFLKATPKTDPSKCNKCGACSRLCPMGSIHKEDHMTITGVCIKCQACVNKCPREAKYFDDPSFLSHVEMLEFNYCDEKTGRREIELFV